MGRSLLDNKVNMDSFLYCHWVHKVILLTTSLNLIRSLLVWFRGERLDSVCFRSCQFGVRMSQPPGIQIVSWYATDVCGVLSRWASCSHQRNLVSCNWGSEYGAAYWSIGNHQLILPPNCRLIWWVGRWKACNSGGESAGGSVCSMQC